MLDLSKIENIYLAPEVTNLRKSIDGCSNIVQYQKGFNELRHRINWTYFTVSDGLANPLYSICICVWNSRLCIYDWN